MQTLKFCLLYLFLGVKLLHPRITCTQELPNSLTFFRNCQSSCSLYKQLCRVPVSNLIYAYRLKNKNSHIYFKGRGRHLSVGSFLKCPGRTGQCQSKAGRLELSSDLPDGWQGSWYLSHLLHVSQGNWDLEVELVFKSRYSNTGGEFKNCCAKCLP